MAAIAVTLNGMLYDKTARTSQPVVFIGMASLTGLGVGGGPIEPAPPEEQPPLVIWGGGNEPFPTPPIVIPIPPDLQPPAPPEGIKPPPPDGGWGYHPDYGWGFFPAGTYPGPKK